MDTVIGFIKVFCEKVWIWGVVAISSTIALFNSSFFKWLGFDEEKRWIIGCVAIVSLSLAIQNICDWIKEKKKRSSIIKNIEYLPKDALNELEGIVRSNKKTLKVKDRDSLEQRRIISHFQLEGKNNYVIFPDWLWEKLVERFGND